MYIYIYVYIVIKNVIKNIYIFIKFLHFFIYPSFLVSLSSLFMRYRVKPHYDSVIACDSINAFIDTTVLLLSRRIFIRIKKIIQIIITIEHAYNI